jgi:hypothetical protein
MLIYNEYKKGASFEAVSLPAETFALDKLPGRTLRVLQRERTLQQIRSPLVKDTSGGEKDG